MSGTPPRIGVALATYNGERFLRTQLESILAQTRLPDEIVVSDDQSSDNSLAIVHDVLDGPCAREGITLTVVVHDNPSGAAANFANALAHCSADLVALCDQDDVWHPHKLDSLAAHFEDDPNLLLVHSDANLIDENGQLLGMGVLESLRITAGEKSDLVSGQGIRALVRRNLVTGQTVMLRGELVDQAGAIPDGWVHDEWWALVAASQDGLLLDPGVYQDYRQHGANEIGADKSGWQKLRERFAEPQEEFRARHRLRHDGLEKYLDSKLWRGTSEAERLLRGRIDHYRWQASLPGARLARIGPVCGRIIRGDYRRFRRGLFDATRDLVQPAS